MIEKMPRDTKEDRDKHRKAQLPLNHDQRLLKKLRLQQSTSKLLQTAIRSFQSKGKWVKETSFPCN